jgi:hypothetical protein
MSEIKKRLAKLPDESRGEAPGIKGLGPLDAAEATVALAKAIVEVPECANVLCVTYRCGHTRPLAEVTQANCPECRKKRRRAKGLKPGSVAEFRFPAGTFFEGVAWNGKEWTATLCVWIGGDPVRFPGAGTGLEPLLRMLKDRYVEAITATGVANLEGRP